MLREYDLAGRFGGEEFSLLLPQTRAVDAFRIAERVRADIAGLSIIAPGATGGERVHVTVSIGVAALDSGSVRKLNELMAAADAALYRAKAGGRDQVQMISTTRGLSAISGPGSEGAAARSAAARRTCRSLSAGRRAHKCWERAQRMPGSLPKTSAGSHSGVRPSGRNSASLKITEGIKGFRETRGSRSIRWCACCASFVSSRKSGRSGSGPSGGAHGVPPRCQCWSGRGSRPIRSIRWCARAPPSCRRGYRAGSGSGPSGGAHGVPPRCQCWSGRGSRPIRSIRWCARRASFVSSRASGRERIRSIRWCAWCGSFLTGQCMIALAGCMTMSVYAITFFPGERTGGEDGSLEVHAARIMSEMFVFTASDPVIRYQ